MNIHFTDKNLFERLKQATIAKVIVGSRLYGTHNDDITKGPVSDVDYLYIYATSKNELNSFINTHHQLQYKENDIDHNFVSLHNFIKNIVSGDSTINFEVVQSDVLKSTDLEWLMKHKQSFITYTIIRSYLGLCRRDIKHFNRANTDYLKSKRLGHIIRGYIYAYNMLNNSFNFDKENLKLKETEINISNNFQLREYDIKITQLRDILSKKLNNNTLGLAQHMNVDDAKLLINDLLNFCESKTYLEKQSILNDFDLDMFINSFENWVEY